MTHAKQYEDAQAIRKRLIKERTYESHWFA